MSTTLPPWLSLETVMADFVRMPNCTCLVYAKRSGHAYLEALIAMGNLYEAGEFARLILRHSALVSELCIVHMKLDGTVVSASLVTREPVLA